MSEDDPVVHIKRIHQLCDMQIKRVTCAKKILQLQRELFQTDMKIKSLLIELSKKKESLVNDLCALHTMQKDQFTEERMMFILKITEDINRLDIPSDNTSTLMDKIKSLESQISTYAQIIEELDKSIPEQESLVVYQRKKINSHNDINSFDDIDMLD